MEGRWAARVWGVADEGEWCGDVRVGEEPNEGRIVRALSWCRDRRGLLNTTRADGSRVRSRENEETPRRSAPFDAQAYALHPSSAGDLVRIF